MTNIVNNKNFLLDTYAKLNNAGIKTFVFGGWAEELLGMISPREHKDVDLLYLANNFELVDRFIKENNIFEVLQKRFAHKRAFEIAGVLIEIVLVSLADKKYITYFFGNYKFEWPADTFLKAMELSREISIASPNALADYRRQHKSIMDKAVSIAIRQTWS